jgi:pilus assembly protein CpaE
MSSDVGWLALVISPSRRILSELVPLLANAIPSANVTELQGYPNRRALVELKTQTPVSLCFLDVMTDRSQAVTCLADVVSINPTAQVVVLISSTEKDYVLQCLRQGAHEFLLHPFTAEQIQTAIERLGRMNPDYLREKAGKVFCLIPAKGACGASTVACNLAYQCRRLGGQRTLLADLDPLTGTVSFLLKLKPTYSFIDAIAHTGNLDVDLWKSLVMQASTMDVLLPPENPVEGIYDISDASPIVEFTRRLYDDIIIDLSGAYGEWSLTAARLADEVLLVTTNELPALQATQRALSYLESNRIPKSRVRLVVNRYNKEVGLTKDMIETALRTEVFQMLPSDYEGVQRALLEGRPVPHNTSFGKGLVQLAERVSGKEQGAAAGASASSSIFSSFTSLFGRRS